MADEEPRKEVIVERDSNSSNMGTIVAVVIGVLLVVLLLVYGVPYLTGSNNSSTDVNVEAPAPSTGTTGQ